MTPLRGRRAWRAAALVALLAATIGGCGQTGPLALPGERPVEQPAPPTQPAEPEAQDEEPENER